MAVKKFLGELNGKRVEGELVKTLIYSLIVSIFVLGVFYFFKFRYMDGFFSDIGYYLFFAVLSYALIVASVRQVRAYREFACMSGMMIGMTSGMVAGFLPGFFIASTNGMFVGSVFGMAVGIAIGMWNGKCCGVMGMLEGIMAGFMGGLMGAMTAFMLFNDNLKAATIIVFLICSSVMICLNYMIYKEMRETKRQREEDHFWTFALTFILIVATTWLMVYGPKSGVFAG